MGIATGDLQMIRERKIREAKKRDVVYPCVGGGFIDEKWNERMDNRGE